MISSGEKTVSLILCSLILERLELRNYVSNRKIQLF